MRGAAARAAGWFVRQRRAVQVLSIVLLAASSFAAVRGFRSLEETPMPIYLIDDSEALARVIRSEVGSGTPQQRVHVAWATRNLAASRHQSVARMACSPCGPQELGRPVSSRQAPTDDDRALARAVLASPTVLDPTGGATHFISPSTQDRLAGAGRPGYAGRPYRVVRQRWSTDYGWQPYYRLGDDLELWGPKR